MNYTHRLLSLTNERLSHRNALTLKNLQRQLYGSVLRSRQPSVSHLLDKRSRGADSRACDKVERTVPQQLRHPFVSPSLLKLPHRFIGQKLHILTFVLVAGENSLAVHLNHVYFLFHF